jgi:hypothetical protein
LASVKGKDRVSIDAGPYQRVSGKRAGARPAGHAQLLDGILG